MVLVSVAQVPPCLVFLCGFSWECCRVQERILIQAWDQKWRPDKYALVAFAVVSEGGNIIQNTSLSTVLWVTETIQGWGWVWGPIQEHMSISGVKLCGLSACFRDQDVCLAVSLRLAACPSGEEEGS